MADQYLKVILNSADKHFTVYIDLPMSWLDFLKDVQNIFPEEDFCKFRKYWTDHEQDKIDIVDNKSYQIFLKMSSTKKIYLQNGNESKQSDESLEVHERVVCDSCDMNPIVGFRYKCVQCPDFDLCGNCEAKREHKEHVMFRFPAPIKNIPFNRRFLRKMKKGCFIHPEGEEGTSHRHSRRHCRNNIFSSLYTMMQDMAEGTECPATEQDDEGVESAPEGEKPEKKNKREKEEGKHRKCGGQRQVPVIDPSYLQAGVEILGNFSEMFSKIINPSTVTVDVEIVPEGQDPNRKPTPKKDDAAAGKKEDAQASTSTPASASAPAAASAPTAAPTPAPEGIKYAGKDGSDVGTSNSEYTSAAEEEGASALISDQSSTGKQVTEQEKEELGWTVISPPPSSPRRDSTTSSSSAESRNSARTQPDSTLKDASPEPNYAKISKDLYEHLQREEKKGSTVQVETTPPSKDSTENRAMIVYHRDYRINKAVHAMMGMGFSNEGNWLTYLLESVNGDIAQAIDLMKPVK